MLLVVEVIIVGLITDGKNVKLLNVKNTQRKPAALKNVAVVMPIAWR